jgi:hypothetical protein
MNQSAWSPTFRGAARVGRGGSFRVAAGCASIMGGPESKPAWSISCYARNPTQGSSLKRGAWSAGRASPTPLPARLTPMGGAGVRTSRVSRGRLDARRPSAAPAVGTRLCPEGRVLLPKPPEHDSRRQRSLFLREALAPQQRCNPHAAPGPLHSSAGRGIGCPFARRLTLFPDD